MSAKKRGASALQPSSSSPTVKKKKTAKKRAPSKKAAMRERMQPDNVAESTNSFIEEAVRVAAESSGDPMTSVLGEAHKLVVGIKLPALSLEWFYRNNVNILGVVTVVVGPEGVMKSGFCCEMFRWARASASAVGHILEHETKMNPLYVESVIGTENKNSMGVHWCDSIDDWQTMLQRTTAYWKGKMRGDSKDPGTGKRFPVYWIIDSVMGKATQESQDRINKDGFAGRNFPAEALSITGFMRAFPQKLRGWPFSLCLVNHLKSGTDQRGLPLRNKAGGQGLNFQESFEIEIKKAKIWKIERVSCNGLSLNLKMHKNSFGQGGQVLNVDVLWWHDEVVNEETGEVEIKQKTVWDWHGATIKLLTGFSGELAKKVKEIVNLTRIPSRNLVWSPTLGIPKESPVEFSEAGRMIYEDEEMMQKLRKLFGIYTRTVFEPGSDYDELMYSGRKVQAERLANDYTDADA